MRFITIYFMLFSLFNFGLAQEYGEALTDSTIEWLYLEEDFFPTLDSSYFYPLSNEYNRYRFGLDSFRNEWYSSHLKVLDEIRLFDLNTDKEIYRFLWLRTFHNPIVIRIEKDGTEYMLFWKLSDGLGGYQPGELLISRSKELDESIWNEFLSYITKCDYWRISSTMEVLGGSDGAQWILEARIKDKYHFVDLWSPSGDYFDCCNFLIELTGLTIKKAEKY